MSAAEPVRNLVHFTTIITKACVFDPAGFVADGDAVGGAFDVVFTLNEAHRRHLDRDFAIEGVIVGAGFVATRFGRFGDGATPLVELEFGSAAVARGTIGA